MKKFTVRGEKKEIDYKFKRYNPIGAEEIKEVTKVMKSGILSGYLGSYGSEFLGGPYVKKFENKMCKYFNTKFAISVNSWTSGLITILGAIGIKPGDEVITTPWTMCATASSILHWNGIPIFCDIEKETFNIDPKKIIAKINKRTKAILVADIFGHGCDIVKLKKIAKKNKIFLITDSAQAPGAKDPLGMVGTSSDIGGFSFNYHKHIHTGEGGVIVTNNAKLAERCRLIRNHAEAVMPLYYKNKKDLQNMLGHNFRLGEIESAIGLKQIDKLNKILKKRKHIANLLTKELGLLEGIRLPIIKNKFDHVYYMYPIILDIKKIKISRKKIVQALEAEGVQGLAEGYQNIHLLPIFKYQYCQSKNFPWDINKNVKYNYKKGMCPIAEELHEKSLFNFEINMFDLKDRDVKFIAKAFKKVWKNFNLIQ